MIGSIRTIVGLLGLSGVLLALVVSKSAEEGRLRDTIAGFEACDAALVGSDLTASAAQCVATTALVHRRATQSEACDAALLGGELFAMRTSCSTEVKTLFAAREAETRRADSLAEILAQERASQAAAITRAETRARTQAERSQRAQSALRDAPRRDDRLVLDAGRLRQLGEADADAERP